MAEELPVKSGNFRVDTTRPRSKSKMRAKIRHILAVASGMFPAMAAFVFIMSLFQIAEQRKNLYLLAAVFMGCGMVSLVFYAWARAEKLRRREISARNREQRQRDQAEAMRREREKRLALQQAAAAPAKEG